eukprot:m.351406 g.351406  ORF g.351406 m.351406 type:complete len:686 (-) comp16241_c0_seq1:5858-7915(-)
MSLADVLDLNRLETDIRALPNVISAALRGEAELEDDLRTSISRTPKEIKEIDTLRVVLRDTLEASSITTRAVQMQKRQDADVFPQQLKEAVAAERLRSAKAIADAKCSLSSFGPKISKLRAEYDQYETDIASTIQKVRTAQAEYQDLRQDLNEAIQTRTAMLVDTDAKRKQIAQLKRDTARTTQEIESVMRQSKQKMSQTVKAEAALESQERSVQSQLDRLRSHHQAVNADILMRVAKLEAVEHALKLEVEMLEGDLPELQQERLALLDTSRATQLETKEVLGERRRINLSMQEAKQQHASSKADHKQLMQTFRSAQAHCLEKEKQAKSLFKGLAAEVKLAKRDKAKQEQLLADKKRVCASYTERVTESQKEMEWKVAEVSKMLLREVELQDETAKVRDKQRAAMVGVNAERDKLQSESNLALATRTATETKLRVEQEQHAQELNEFQGQESKLQGAISTLESTLAADSTKADKLTMAVASLVSQELELKRKLPALQKQEQAAQAAHDAFETKAHATLTSLRTRLEEVTRQDKEAQDPIDLLHQEIANEHVLLQEHQDEQFEAEQVLQTRTAALSSVQEEYQRVLRPNQVAREQLHALERTLQEQLRVHRGEKQDILEKLALVQQRHSTVQDCQLRLQTQIDTLNADIAYCQTHARLSKRASQSSSSGLSPTGSMVQTCERSAWP